jgi:hypothetical protein
LFSRFFSTECLLALDVNLISESLHLHCVFCVGSSFLTGGVLCRVVFRDGIHSCGRSRFPLEYFGTAKVSIDPNLVLSTRGRELSNFPSRPQTGINVIFSGLLWNLCSSTIFSMVYIEITSWALLDPRQILHDKRMDICRCACGPMHGHLSWFCLRHLQRSMGRSMIREFDYPRDLLRIDAASTRVVHKQKYPRVPERGGG